MGSGKSPTKLVIEICVIAFFAEIAVMLVLPRIVGDVAGWKGALLDGFILASVVGPVVLWRVTAWSGRAASLHSIAATSRLSGLLVVFGVLAIGIPLSLAIATVLGTQISATAESRFDAVVLQTKRSLYDWAFRPIYGMHGARGVYAASEEVSAEEFTDYVDSRDLPEEFPGVTQMGLLVREGENPDACDWVVRHAEPSLDEGLSAGARITDESLRHLLQIGTQGGKNLLTPRVRLPIGDGESESMMWLVPVYANNADRGTPESNWSSLNGILFTTFDPEGLSDRIEPALGEMASLELLAGNGSLLSITNADHEGAEGVQKSLIERDVPLEIGGQQWTLRFHSTPAFDAGIDRSLPLLVAAGGIAISALFAGFLHAVSSARRRAIRIAEEMTERVRTLSAVAMNTTNAVIITDAAQRITWVNRGFTDMTGYSLDEVEGRAPGSFLQCEKTDEATRKEIRAAISRGRGYQGEILNRAKDGREYWLNLDIQPLRDESGEITGFMAVENDLTEIKTAKLEAERANDAKSRFLSSMSHEIRTPLNGIIGFADLLQRGADEGDEATRAEWVGIIHGSGEHLLCLLNDVLDLSKLDAERMDIGLAPCNPRAVISDAAMVLRSRADEKGLAFTERFEDSVPTAIRSDKTRIRQIVMNLVSNAVKFTEEGSVGVSVSAEGDGEARTVRIEVRDTGIGMSEDQVRNLFSPFQQADITIARDFGGTGLGLSISRELARKLGGDITVRSAEGLGSVFTVILPAPPLLPGESLPSAIRTREIFGNDGAARPIEGARILVADDIEANRKVAQMFLSRAGAEVVTAENGEEAVAAASASEFDLILMDVQMPRLNGLDATRRIRESGVAVPILALTAFSSGGDRNSCLDAGMNDFLAKPFETAVLIQTVARWIRAGGDFAPDVGTAAEGGSPDAINIEEFRSDPDLAGIAKSWLDALPEKLDAIDRALAEGDFTEVAKMAHAIHGSGGSLGMPMFTKPAHELENAAIDAHARAAREFLDELRAAHADAYATISGLAA